MSPSETARRPANSSGWRGYCSQLTIFAPRCPERLGDELPEFLASYDRPAVRGLRMNPAKPVPGEVRPEGQAFLFIRGRRNPRAGRHEGLLLLRPAQEHGPEESRIGFGHAAEVFGPVSGTDNQIFQHAFFLRDWPARPCRGA